MIVVRTSIGKLDKNRCNAYSPCYLVKAEGFAPFVSVLYCTRNFETDANDYYFSHPRLLTTIPLKIVKEIYLLS